MYTDSTNPCAKSKQRRNPFQTRNNMTKGIPRRPSPPARASSSANTRHFCIFPLSSTNQHIARFPKLSARFFNLKSWRKMACRVSKDAFSRGGLAPIVPALVACRTSIAIPCLRQLLALTHCRASRRPSGRRSPNFHPLNASLQRDFFSRKREDKFNRLACRAPMRSARA